MKKIIISLFCACTIISTASANESFSSEFSHFAGGAVMAGGIAAAVDSYYPEYKQDRGAIGFYVSSAAIIVEQSIEAAVKGNVSGQLLDAASHIAGSALGAYISDKYLLTPVVKTAGKEGNFFGLSFVKTF